MGMLKVLTHNLFFIFLSLIILCVACSREQSIQDLNKDAMKAYSQKQVGRAIELASKALLRANKEAGPSSELTGETLQQLGLFYSASGDTLNAEKYYLKALPIVEAINGLTSTETARLMNNIAGVYTAKGDIGKATSYYQQTLEIAKQIFKPGDPRLETIKNNLEECRTKMASAGDSASLPASHPKDMVPEMIKNFAIENFAKANVVIGDLHPESPVPISGEGVVFPYRCVKKEENGNSIQAVIVFAAVKVKGQEGKYVFRESRLVAYESYISDLKKGGLELLRQEFIRLFPKVYS